MTAAGTPQEPLIKIRETLDELSDKVSDLSSRRSSIDSTESHSGRSSTRQTSIASEHSHVEEAGRGVVGVAGFGDALGFVLGAGGALYNHADWKEVLEEGFETGLAVGVGEGVAKFVTPTFAKAGVSVVHASVAAGAAMFDVFPVWDVAKWAKHDITAVELRQNLAESAAGTAGSVAGGIALGAAGGIKFGPVGAFFSAIIGGIAGGFSGAAAGKAIDKAIWEEGEDSIMNSYEFFGWHDVDRGTRPIKSERSIKEAYLRKLDEKPSKKIKDENWATFCTANLMLLLKAMFPEFKKMLKIAEDLRNNSSKGVSIIGTLLYNSIVCPLQSLHQVA